MRILSFQIILIFVCANIFAQSPHGKYLEIDCSVCHQSDTWKVDPVKISFNHSGTKFSLIGQHQNVDCKSCHSNLVFNQAGKDCNSCHNDIHQGTVGFDCSNCHSPTSWIVKDINRVHQFSRFPLLGAHKLADCSQCHNSYPELKFDVLNVDCFACHSDDYNFAISPNHITANFSKECQECHSSNSFVWNASNVNHSFFPLVGGHALPGCYSCHKTNTFKGLSTECYVCHKTNFETTVNPNHISTGLPTTCDVCHSITAWSPASFNHNLTQFPLSGKHINVKCNDCHKTGYTGTSTDCYSCHQNDYQSVSDPNHVLQNYPKDCTQCHSTSGWDGAKFDHNQSGFPLTGSHIQVSCASCHTGGYSGISTDCVSCHQTDFQQTINPNHVAISLPTNCESCHTTNPGWNPALFPLHNNYFPLVGAHALIKNCNDCHKGNYNTTPKLCYDCHATDFNSVNNPPHQSQNLSHDCLQCHNMNSWSGATFNHSFFPISNKHSKVSCNQCHSETGYKPQCLSCHLNKFLDKHKPGDRTDCWNCHTTNNWD